MTVRYTTFHYIGIYRDKYIFYNKDIELELSIPEFCERFGDKNMNSLKVLNGNRNSVKGFKMRKR